MAKGYWVARVDVADPEQYKRYVVASAAAYAKHGAVVLARGGRSEVVEGQGRSRNVIWEFPSFEAALACYHSEEYRAARSMRESVAEGDFVIVEGVE